MRKSPTRVGHLQKRQTSFYDLDESAMGSPMKSRVNNSSSLMRYYRSEMESQAENVTFKAQVFKNFMSGKMMKQRQNKWKQEPLYDKNGILNKAKVISKIDKHVNSYLTKIGVIGKKSKVTTDGPIFSNDDEEKNILKFIEADLFEEDSKKRKRFISVSSTVKK